LDEHGKALKVVVAAGQKLVSQSPKENTQPLGDWMRCAEMEWEELGDTVNKRPAELEELEKQWQTYLDGVTAFETWLHGMEVKVRDLEPVSSDPEQQQRQLEQQKILQDELNEQEPALGGISASGNHIIEESKLLVSTASLEARIAQINKRWKTLHNSVEERRGDLGDPHVKRSRLLRQMADLLGWLSEVRKRFDYMLSHPLGGDFQTVSVQVQLHTGPNGLKSQLDEKSPDVERMLVESKELQNGGEGVSQSDKALLNSISQVQEELRRTWTELVTKSDNWSKQLDKAYQEMKLFEDTCNDLQGRLQRFEKGMEDEGPVSNDPAILRRQSLETETRQTEMNSMNEQLKVIHDSVTRQRQMGIDIPEATTQRIDKLESKVKKDQVQGTNRIQAVERAMCIINAMPEFPVPKLPDGWVRAETANGIPYFVYHNSKGGDELQWIHPEMSKLFAAFGLLVCFGDGFGLGKCCL
jgi:chromosome segregation ATPase